MKPLNPNPAVLAIILAGYLMIVLDISIVITALPKIQHSLNFSATGLSWVQNAYTLVFGGLLLLGARAGDMLGRRRMFLAGLAVFSAASLAIGMAQSAAWLLAARAMQGVGAAILAPSTLALLSTGFAEGPARTRALSWYAATAGVGASVGLVLGGVLADWVSWRVGFFINVPLGLALMLAARRHIAEMAARQGNFDLAGAFTSTFGMGALVYGIVRAASAGWGDTLTIAAVGAGIVLLAVFGLVEARASQPIMPLRLFASRERAGAYAARMLFLGAMMGFWFFTTQFLQGVLGFRPAEAGLAFLPATLPNFAAAIVVPRLTRRLGNGRVLATGLTLALAGMAWLSRASVDSLYLSGVALPMVLIGLGQGLTLGPLTVAGVAGVDAQDAGAASGAVNVAHQLGGSLGLSVLIVVFAAAGTHVLDGRALLAQRISSALGAGTAMLVLSLLAVLTLILPSVRAVVRENFLITDQAKGKQ
jgi:EmrB/QacA subfamily drug resistance transporter